MASIGPQVIKPTRVALIGEVPRRWEHRSTSGGKSPPPSSQYAAKTMRKPRMMNTTVKTSARFMVGDEIHSARRARTSQGYKKGLIRPIGPIRRAIQRRLARLALHEKRAVPSGYRGA